MSGILLALRVSSKRVGVPACQIATISSSFTLPSRSYGDAKEPQKDNSLYTIDSQAQGHINDPKNRHKRDPEGQSAKGGKAAHQQSDAPLDAASSEKQSTVKEFGKGNKERVGFVEQVGSGSGTARQFEESK